MKISKDQIKSEINKVLNNIETNVGEFEKQENEDTLAISFILEDGKGSRVCCQITSLIEENKP